MDLEYSTSTKQNLDFDRKHLWHPYTSLNNPLPVIPVKGAIGSTFVCDSIGEDHIIDAMSSWWCAIHGYNNKRLNDAITYQLVKFSHVLFGGFTHEPAIDLVRKLLKLIDEPSLKYCFLADSGSVAVEVAMKFAFQASLISSQSKNKFLTIKRGYHGDTFGAMSVCDPVSSMHNIYGDYLPKNIFVTEPSVIEHLPFSLYGNECMSETQTTQELEQIFSSHHDELCAVILEPLLQGAGGMRLYHPQFLIEIKRLCLKHNVLLIFDEIATGFGRTGEIFAFKHCNLYQDKSNIPVQDRIDVVPDILCVGKALTGGYMTLSAVVVNNIIADRLSHPNNPTHGCFMHGPTFMGNALACSVANASLDILLEGKWKKQVTDIEKMFDQKLYLYIKDPSNCLIDNIVKRISVVGAVAVVELFHDIDTVMFQKWTVQRRVNIRPFRNLIYVMPPYIIKKEELNYIIECIIEFLSCLKDNDVSFFVQSSV